MKRDIVVASVEAIVAGTNALLAKREGLGRSEPVASETASGPIEGV